MQRPFKWALIGVGAIADYAIGPAINRHEPSELSAVVGRDLGRARDFASRHGSPAAFDDVATMLAGADVDAVYIASPNGLHVAHATAAAVAGKHVLCDKPLATTVSDAQKIIDVCQRSGVGLGVMFQVRKYGGVEHAVRAVRDASIGEVSLVEVSLGPGRLPLGGWHADPASAGAGVMNNAAIHLFDLLRFVLSAEVTEAVLMCDRSDSSGLDVGAAVLLRFDSGAIAYVNANQSLLLYSSDVRIYGSRGRFIGRDVTHSNREGVVTIENERGAETVVTDSFDGHYRILSDFVDAVRNGTPQTPSGHDGLRAVEIVAALQAAEAQRLIASL